MSNFRFSIRTLLLLTALFVGFLVANQTVENRVEAIAANYSFEPENAHTVDPETETPKIFDLIIDASPTLLDYLLFRRKAILTCKVELEYSGEYGGGLSHRQPGVPDTKIQCHDHYSVGLFYTRKTLHHDYQIGWSEMEFKCDDNSKQPQHDDSGIVFTDDDVWNLNYLKSNSNASNEPILP